MALMFPDQVDDDAPSSERRVFDAFSGGLPADWVVIHSRRFIRPATEESRPWEGEVDFIVLSPDHGYLGLEVKGGGIARTSDGWRSIDRRGVEHPIKDPGKQAQRGIHAVGTYVRSSRNASPMARGLRYGWGVVFPDILDRQLPATFGPELLLDQVVTSNGLEDPRAALCRVFEAQGMTSPPIPAEVSEEFIRIVYPELRIASSLVGNVHQGQKRLIELTEEQSDYLFGFANDLNRLAIRGAAGTGKTLIGMKKAKAFAEAGKRTLFLCFNAPLAAELQTDARGFVVSTFHQFCRRLARMVGLPFQPPSNEVREQEFWQAKAPELLIEALAKLPDERWDAIVVDEGQDFRELWWHAIQDALHHEGSSLWVFYDPNQDLYGGEAFDDLDLQRTQLTYNCRNTRPIGRYSCGFVGVEPKFPRRSLDGLEVQSESCADERQMVRFVRHWLHHLIAVEGVASNTVVVLSPNSTRMSKIWAERRLGNFELVELGTVPGPNEVVFSSIRSFKGLEADFVILCELRRGGFGSDAKDLYVASSRARLGLFAAEFS